MKYKKLFLIIIISIVLVYSNSAYQKYKANKINRIIESKSYSYLPREAKNYIKKVYEETGEVILTEKNKKENTPYLNPKYVKYIALSQEEKDKIGEVPETYTIDYIENDIDGTNLPTSYDLRNVNNKSYITPLKDQGSLDICWTLATVEQAESYLMVKNNQPYNSNSQLFSARQIDYITSSNGIKDYNNEDGVRTIGTGANFFLASLTLANGASLVDNSVLPYSNSTVEKELQDIINYDNSLYEVNTTLSVPSISSDSTQSEINSIVNLIKTNIMEYGGAYVGTESPNYSCGSKNTDNNYIIRVDDSCEQNAGHAMQIIGWDDNYSYSYCVSNNKHITPNSTCSKTTGKGAWIVRNSWGSNFSYVYLAYDSMDDDINFITSLEKKSNRTWKNNYHSAVNHTYIWYGNRFSQDFTKKINTPEKIEKVKFYAYSQNGRYTISVSSENNTYNNITEVTVPYPGIYTIDLSDKNIIINDEEFTVTITGSGQSNFISGTMSVFTSNLDSTPIILTDAEIEREKSDSNYEFRLYSLTKNITSNTTPTYTLFNKNGTDVSNYLSVQYNKVAKNDINALVNISSSIKPGNYNLKITYNSAEDTVPIKITGYSETVVNYYPNNGTGTMPSQTIETGNSITLNENTFTRTGYKFKDWNTKANGSGETYTDKQYIETLEDDLNLYAQWIVGNYNLDINFLFFRGD